MKKILYFNTLSLSLLVCLNACNGGNSTNTTAQKTAQSSRPTALKQDTKLKNTLAAVMMGSGIESITAVATDQSCLKATANEKNIYIANPKALISLDQSQDLNALQNSLGVDVSGKFGVDRFSLNFNALFANASKNNNYVTNLIYLYKYAGEARFHDGSLKESDDALTKTAANLVHTDQRRFKQMCGENFVSQMDAGATLGIRLSLAFNSHSDQEKFQAKFNSNLGLADIASSIEQASANSNVHVGFSISAIQQGGEPQKLNDIFGKIGPDGLYPFLNCGSVGSPNEAACKEMMAAIITYAETLKDQLNGPDGNLKLDNLYYTNPKLSSYSAIGVKVGSIDPSPETLKAMRDLTANYDKTEYDYIFATHYLTALRYYVDGPTKELLRDTADRLYKQLSIYTGPSYNVLNCFMDTVSDNCVNIKQGVDEAVQEVALSDLELRLLDYLENTSYSTELINYNGGPITDPKSYSKTPGCILAPVSAPNYARYALNCDGNWLTLPGKLQVVTNGIKGWLNVSGLSYYSGPADSVSMLITYPDLGLNQDSWNPNYYYEDQILIQAESAPNFTNYSTHTDIGITKLLQNQA